MYDGEVWRRWYRWKPEEKLHWGWRLRRTSGRGHTGRSLENLTFRVKRRREPQNRPRRRPEKEKKSEERPGVPNVSCTGSGRVWPPTKLPCQICSRKDKPTRMTVGPNCWSSYWSPAFSNFQGGPHGDSRHIKLWVSGNNKQLQSLSPAIPVGARHRDRCKGTWGQELASLCPNLDPRVANHGDRKFQSNANKAGPPHTKQASRAGLLEA